MHILATLERAYAEWAASKEDWAERKLYAVDFAAHYDWEVVWPKYFRPILEEMERMKSEREKEGEKK